MPKYEYACRQCGNNLEVVQSFSDSPLTECPSCQGELRKVFHSPGITFKGSGFYKTDSRNGSKSSSSSTSSDSTKSTTDTAKAETASSSDTKKNGSDSKTTSADSAKSPSGVGAKSD